MFESINTLLLTLSLSRDSDRADSLRPKELMALRPYRMACSWLPVTVWLPRLRSGLDSLPHALAGHRPYRYYNVERFPTTLLKPHD